MKLSISTFIYLNYPLEEAVRRIACAGYEAVEIWGGRPHAYRDDLSMRELERVRLLISGNGLTISAFIPAQFRYPTNLCISNEKIRQDSISYIKQSMDTATALGSPMVTVCPGHSLYGQPKADAWSRLRDSLQILSGCALEKGIKLVLEPADKLETDLIQTTNDCLRMIEEVGADNLGILLDVGHSHIAGEVLAEAVESVIQARGRLGQVPLHVHIDDNHGLHDEHLVPGRGNIDFGSFLQTLKAVKYGGYLTVELGFSYTAEPDDPVREAQQYLAGLLSNRQFEERRESG